MALKDIETIVIVMLENRSFDHVVGYLSLLDTNIPIPVNGLQGDPACMRTMIRMGTKSILFGLAQMCSGSTIRPTTRAASIDK